MRIRTVFAAAAIAAVGAVFWSAANHKASGDEVAPFTHAGTVVVVPERPVIAGYDRSCRAGHGCVFGPAWSDDVDVDGGHDGCDTRNDILRRDLHSITLKAHTNGCVVLSGILNDPYSGTAAEFQRGQRTSGDVQIDHVFPLAAAWDFGAAGWTPQRRADFANDPRNLIATLGTINEAKGDRTPSEWMPEHGRCRYAAAYLDVALAYQLAISVADQRALVAASESC